MATAPKPAPPSAKPIVTAPVKTSERKTQPEGSFLFGKENYMLMLGGLALIFLGFFLMAGGKSANPHEFHYSEIYSFRRITLAPIVLLAGFAVEVYAIMKKPKEIAA